MGACGSSSSATENSVAKQPLQTQRAANSSKPERKAVIPGNGAESLSTLLQQPRVPVMNDESREKARSALRRDRKCATWTAGKGPLPVRSTHAPPQQITRRAKRTRTVTFGDRETLEFAVHPAHPAKVGNPGKLLCEVRRTNSTRL